MIIKVFFSFCVQWLIDSKGNPRCITNSKGRKRRPGSKDLTSILKNCDPVFVNFVSRCLEYVDTVTYYNRITVICWPPFFASITHHALSLSLYRAHGWMDKSCATQCFKYSFFFVCLFVCVVDRWDPSKRMNPDEAYRHEWFTGGSSPVTANVQMQSPLSSSTATTTKAKKCSGGIEESDGIFSGSSTSSAGSGPSINSQQQQQLGSNGAEKLTKYQVYKGKKQQPLKGAQDQTKEASQRDSARSAVSTANNNKRVDGEPNNFDDSGTYLPTIL